MLSDLSLHGQLYWREFYYTCALGTPNYEMMAGNPICRQVDWDDDDEKLAAWKEARLDPSRITRTHPNSSSFR